MGPLPPRPCEGEGSDAELEHSESMTELDVATAAAILKGVSLNLIRRGDDGSLVLSMDHWRFAGLADGTLTFTPEPPAPPETEPLVIPLSDVASISWDRL